MTATTKAKAKPRVHFSDWEQTKVTAILVLADGTVIEGVGFGAEGEAVAEVCFNTAMTGYQEVLTDPSYAGQIVTFTFPHIGNVGTNDDDIETTNLAASAAVKGCIVKAPITEPANYRSAKHFDKWLKARGIIGLSGVDTRELTNLIREKGMPNGVIAHNSKGKFDVKKLTSMARAWSGLEGLDLAKDVSLTQRMAWDEKGLDHRLHGRRRWLQCCCC
jgi:carbamoyl-phosphate synthase small subunit